jgi:hypothetical protein
MGALGYELYHPALKQDGWHSLLLCHSALDAGCRLQAMEGEVGASHYDPSSSLLTEGQFSREEASISQSDSTLTAAGKKYISPAKGSRDPS